MSLTYNPDVFTVDSLQAASAIILTPEDSTTEARWRVETPYLADLIGRHLDIGPQSLVLDYGCGVGRMARELITRHDCWVVGVDISQSMRALAHVYVNSERFFACSPEMLDTLIARGVTFDAGLAIWVLQHCLEPNEDLDRISRAMRPGGRLFVFNNRSRAVPTEEHAWVDDGLDLYAMLSDRFVVIDGGAPAVEHTTPSIAQHTFWAAYRRP